MKGRSMLQQQRMRKSCKGPKIKRDQCFIYFIGAIVGTERLVKIGFTAVCAQRRMNALQLGSPVELSLIGFFEGREQDELDLHFKFKHLRRHREWFLLDDALEADINFFCRDASL